MTGIISSSTPLLGDKGQGSQQPYFYPSVGQNAYVTDSHFELERRRQRSRRRWSFILILATILLVSFWGNIRHFAHKLLARHEAVRSYPFLF